MNSFADGFPANLLDALRNARKLAVLTGSGISAESGVPTFRDAQTGLWSKFRPEDLATPEAFQRNPKLVWEWYAWRRELVSQAQPNTGHLALVELEKRIPRFTLITQNVDGLHHAAGSTDVIELHGSVWRARCLACRAAHDVRGLSFDNGTPSCLECGNHLRPDVVLFGETLPPGAFERAAGAAESCELCFVVGTSAVVYPAASLPEIARAAGAFVVEVNAERTPLSEFCDEVLTGKAGEILPLLD